MEKVIGTTELRQRLTDVLQALRDERATYIIETFARPQAALISMEDYRQFQRYREERETFFERLDAMAVQNASRNQSLTGDEILTIIEQARQDYAGGRAESCSGSS